MSPEDLIPSQISSISFFLSWITPSNFSIFCSLSSKILDKLEIRKKELAQQIYEPNALADGEVSDVPVVDEPESIPVVDEPDDTPVVDEPTDTIDTDYENMVSAEDEVGSEIEG